MQQSPSSKRRICSGHGKESPSKSDFCPTCVHQSLLNLKHLHEAAMERRNVARQEFAERLPELLLRGQQLSELGFESEQLRAKLAVLRKKCCAKSIQIAEQVVENDERRAQQTSSVAQRVQLHRLENALYHVDTGTMSKAIVATTTTIRRLRFHQCLAVFGMFRLHVDKVEKKRPTERQRHARGIGKIGGLPLPNAGAELYGVLPPVELQSALRLVAALTCTLARCLGIILPHPILLQPHGPRGDVIDGVTDEDIEQGQAQQEAVVPEEANTLLTSTKSLLSLMDSSTWGKSAKNALQLATGSLQQEPPSMDISAVSQRLLHAKAAVICEDDSNQSGQFALLVSGDQDDFATGLLLLQNNVIALCIRAGVEVDELWPAGAVLLNLHALFLFSQQQVLKCDEFDENKATKES